MWFLWPLMPVLVIMVVIGTKLQSSSSFIEKNSADGYLCLTIKLVSNEVQHNGFIFATYPKLSYFKR